MWQRNTMTNRLTAILLVIGLTGALAYTGNFDVGYGRYGPGIYGGISAYGGAYPGGQYPGLTDQVAVTGYARFIGPLSADCVASVNGILIGQNKTLTADGKIAVNGSLPVDVFPGCVDTFTGLRTPFFVYAESAAATGTDNKTFIISPVTKINEWADQGTSTNTAASAYARLGVVPPTGISADTNTISLLAAGGASTEVGVAMLAADVAYSNYLLVGAKWLYAVSKATNASRACGTIDDFVDALGYHVAAVTNATTTFNTSNADALTAALKGAANVCVFNLNQTSANLTDYTPIAANVAATIAGLNSAVAGAAKEASADTLIASVFYLIKLSGAVQAELGFAANVTASWAAADSTAALAKLESAVDSFAPNYATILTAIGATGAPTTLFATKAVTVKVFGNVDKAKTAAADVLKLTQQTGTTSNGSVSLASSGTAVFSAANGGNDTLTQAAVKVGLAAILPFATTTTVTPMSPLIYFTWAGLNVADGPTLVEAKHIAAVYQGFTGVTNTTGFTIDTFTTQGFSQGSAAQLLFLAADQLVYSLPLLGATFVAGAKTGADIDNEALALYQALYNKALATLKTNLITNDDVVSLIKARFNGDLSTDGSNVPFGSSRKLLQTATIDTVLAAMASAITESNTRMNNILAAAAASQNTGSTLDKTAFLTLAKIAKLQATEIAAAIANIAASVRSGDLTTALSLANKASSDFSGANLDSAIARQSVNEAGLADLANTDLDTLTGGGSSSDDKKKKIALGVGLGVGLGVPFLIALIALVVIFAKKRRGSQATAPAAVSESWINTNNRVAPETAEAEESMIASYYQRRLMNQ